MRDVVLATPNRPRSPSEQRHNEGECGDDIERSGEDFARTHTRARVHSTSRGALTETIINRPNTHKQSIPRHLLHTHTNLHTNTLMDTHTHTSPRTRRQQRQTNSGHTRTNTLQTPQALTSNTHADTYTHRHTLTITHSNSPQPRAVRVWK